MKKLAAMFLAGIMVLGMGMSAMADEAGSDATTGDNTTTESATTTYTDMSTVTITKTYELVGEGSSPAETFVVTQVGSGTVKDGDAESAPNLTSISDVTYEKGAAGSENKTGTFTVTLPTYTKTGVYEYTLQETAGKTAGVTYRTATMKLVVTVIEQGGLVRVAGVHTEAAGGTKTSSFSDNTYTANELTVTKKVEGNMGDKSKEFKFTVTFEGPTDKTWKNEITIADGSGATGLTWSGNVATFTLSDGDSVTFENVPAGVTYTVDEEDYTSDGYTTDGEVTKATAMTKDGASVTVTNTKTGDVDTGISLDSLPYIMIMVIAVLGLAVVATRRRAVR